jgi:hypothetical protein
MKFHLHNSRRPDSSRLFAFLKMSSDEQKHFIQRRFENIDATELANILKAIYGHPHDKGRPRRQQS